MEKNEFIPYETIEAEIESYIDNDKIKDEISKTLKISKKQVNATLDLLAEGNTVPFIARYRKEVTGELDEDQIRDIEKTWEYEIGLAERKTAVIKNIAEQGKLTEELKQQILKAEKLTEVEDLYLPYKQKKQTRATKAKKKGLEPLAEFLMSFPKDADVIAEATKYVNDVEDKNLAVKTPEEALKGAQDIIAEMTSEVAEYRKWIRFEYTQNALLVTALKDETLDERKVYEMYYDYKENINTILPHRVLAVNRAEKEKVLTVKLAEDEEKILDYLMVNIIGNDNVNSVTTPYVEDAITDGYRRLTKGAIDRELRSELKDIAETQAIDVFGDNLRKLLLQPPLKDKTMLGVDPAYRTGCKLAVLEPTGKMVDIDVIYPTQKYPGENIPQSRLDEAKKKVLDKIKKHKVELVAIGNGTASRETEQFISELISDNKLDVSYIIVNEAGASVYSASKLAKKEFPELQVEERSAVSIARRVQDPLAELVKIDPKSLGVGQYQHDVTQSKLKEQLDFVVEKAVNQIGVNVNTASWALLKYVAGISQTLAENIVETRDNIGKFTTREELKNVPRFGGKTYEQAIGFIRIFDGENSLDKTPIHPESYEATYKLLEKLGLSTADVGTDKMKEEISKIDRKEIAKELEMGEITLNDICDALVVPLRDMRDEFPQPLLKKGVLKLEDLSPGMELQGTIRNVVDFGAFVDCGVKVDGLVHISKLTRDYVKHPKDAVSVGDIVTVWVKEVDTDRQRLALTMIQE